MRLEDLKQQEDLLPSLVRELWQEEVRRNGKEYIAFCHFHDDKNNPNFTIFEKNGIWFFKCFACGESGDAINFVEKVLNCSFIEAVRFLEDFLGCEIELENNYDYCSSVETKRVNRAVTSEKKNSGGNSKKVEIDVLSVSDEWLTELWKKCNKAVREDKDISIYLKHRGIESNYEQFCGSLIELDGNENALAAWLNEKREQGYKLVFPVFSPEGKVINLVLRDITGERKLKVLNLPGRSVYPVGLGTVKQDEPCILCEGVMDYLTLCSILTRDGYVPNVVAVTGANIFREEWASQFPREVFIIYDRDQAGLKGAKKAYRLLKKAGKNPKVCFLPAKSSGKDLNDFLLLCGSDNFSSFLASLLQKASDFPVPSVSIFIEQMINYPQEEKVYQVGFLSETTFINALTPGLYIIGGVPGVGKTALALDTALKTAENHKVLFFEQELSLKETTARLLSRIISESGERVTWEEIYKSGFFTTGFDKEKRSLFTAFIESKSHLLSNIFIHDAGEFAFVEDIVEAIEEFIETADEKPVVFIDYLQVLQSKKEHTLRRSEVGYIAYELASTAARLEIPIILVSSLSRAAYKAVDMMGVLAAFKEAGEIEYSASGLIGLTFYTGEEEKSEVLDEVMKSPVKPLIAVVPKIRAGIPRTFYLKFDGYTMSFQRINKEEANELLEKLKMGACDEDGEELVDFN